MLDVENHPVSDGNGGTTTYPPSHYGFTKTTFSQWINSWCTKLISLAAADGITINPVLYCGWDTSVNYIDSTIWTKYPLWRPEWPASPNPQTGGPSHTTSPWPTWDFWQYSATTNVPGIGTSDVDVLQGDQYTLQDYILGSPGHWADGSWVQVNSASGVYAWNDSTASGTKTLIPNGTTGKILAGPIYGSGYMEWQVQYSNGVTGW